MAILRRLPPDALETGLVMGVIYGLMAWSVISIGIIILLL